MMFERANTVWLVAGGIAATVAYAISRVISHRRFYSNLVSTNAFTLGIVNYLLMINHTAWAAALDDMGPCQDHGRISR